MLCKDYRPYHCIASRLLIGLYIAHEVSYDRFNKSADPIVRVTMDYNFGGRPQTSSAYRHKSGSSAQKNIPFSTSLYRDKNIQTNKSGCYVNKVFEEKQFLYDIFLSSGFFLFHFLREIFQRY